MRHVAAAAFVLLAACSQEVAAPPTNEAERSNEAHLNAPAPSEPGGLRNDSTPIAEGAMDPKSPQEAREVLQRYFALVAAGRHGEAAELWWDEDRATAFAAQLRKLGDFQPSIAAPGRVEGAAGSAYVEISLQLLRRQRSRIESLSDGTAVLRRSNDVPGSTPEQRRWRIDRITLQPPPVPLPASFRFVGRWATDARNCEALAWRFTVSSLSTPAGSQCAFTKVTEVPGGYDIAARCTAEGPVVGDMLKLRFAESARALLFESGSIADAGLVRCP